MSALLTSESAAPENAGRPVAWTSTGRAWKLRSGGVRIGPATDLRELPADLARARGVDDVESFLSPSVSRDLKVVADLGGLDEAADRLASAILKGERVALFGDYDVDGATSVAIMARQLRAYGLEIEFHVPDRIEEGYGANADSLSDMASRCPLVVVLDSGTNAPEAIKAARERGADVIVVDHHLQAGGLPDAAIVNPNLERETGACGYMCTAGLAYALALWLDRAVERQGGQSVGVERQLLGLAALGTVADVMPLVGLNRSIVAEGVACLGANPGVAALAVKRGVEEPYTAGKCGFQIGPCLNAGGRIGDAKMSASLLMSDDAEEIKTAAARLSDLNDERKRIERLALREASDMIEAGACGEDIAVIHHPAWHPGIVGLVASRIKERFDVSAVVVGAGGKGSGRAVEGFDLGGAVIDAAAEGILERGGGHKVAAGLTVKPAKLAAFRRFMEARAQGVARPAIQSDIEAEPGDVTVRTLEACDALAPYGAGNPAPKVAVSGGRCVSVKILKEVHVKVSVQGSRGRTEGIAFNVVGTPLGDALLASEGRLADLYGKAEVNEFRGSKRVQILVEDVRLPVPAESG